MRNIPWDWQQQDLYLQKYAGWGGDIFALTANTGSQIIKRKNKRVGVKDVLDISKAFDIEYRVWHDRLFE